MTKNTNPETTQTKEYDVSCRIEGRFHVLVSAESLAEAEKKATLAYQDADFGATEDVDMEIIHIIEDDNKYHYPPFQ